MEEPVVLWKKIVDGKRMVAFDCGFNDPLEFQLDGKVVRRISSAFIKDGDWYAKALKKARAILKSKYFYPTPEPQTTPTTRATVVIATQLNLL